MDPEKHFLFRLALEMHRTVAELLDSGLTTAEFADWYAYFSLEAERAHGAGRTKFTRSAPPSTMGG